MAVLKQSEKRKIERTVQAALQVPRQRQLDPLSPRIAALEDAVVALQAAVAALEARIAALETPF